MSNPSDSRKRAARRVSSPVLALICAVAAAPALLLPWLSAPARAGVATEEGRSAFDAGTARHAASAPAAGSRQQYQPHYQLRCWQLGRLVIDERLDLPPEGVTGGSPPGAAGGPSGLRLRATDANHQPLYLTETRNATCLVRSVATETPAGR